MKSGYKLLAQEQATAVLTTVGHEIWKQVWSMAAQNKVRNFSWRAIWNSIPTKANLVRWCVIGEDIYDHCQQTPEDVIHALWLCPQSIGLKFESLLEFSHHYSLSQFQ